MPARRIPIEDRFWTKVQEDPSGCWLWTSTLSSGYGQVKVNGKYIGAHRVAYELVVGCIPKGLVIDHLCRNPRCVNPAHLEPVRSRTNVIRGKTVIATNVAKTICKNGHELTKENVRRYRGERVCRACKREWMRKKRKALASR